VNAGGYYEGGVPSFWGSNNPLNAFVHAVEVYAGTATPAEIAGGSLTALPSSGSSYTPSTTTTTTPSTTTTTTTPSTTTTTTPSTPKITSASPSSPKPGETVTLTGTNFGSSAGFVQLYQSAGSGPVSWGAPGNAATFHLGSWSDTSVSFTAPLPSGTNGIWALQPGKALVRVVNSSGTVSPWFNIDIAADPQVSAIATAPGATMTVTGTGFGRTPGFVQLYQATSSGAVSWGAPGNAATFKIVSWTPSSVTFVLPLPSGTGGVWALKAGPALVRVNVDGTYTPWQTIQVS